MRELQNPPIYLGGMILSGDIDSVYRYESAIYNMVTARWKKYTKRWAFFMDMNDIFKKKKKAGHYRASDFHIVGDDPLVPLPHEIDWLLPILLLKGKKLNILELEVYKLARRRGQRFVYW